jgi:hypothetical protein
MQGRDKGTKRGKGFAQRDPSLFEWGVEDGSLSLVNDLVANSCSQLTAQASRAQTLQSEMNDLTKWLENDMQDADREDPWRMVVRSDAMSASPTEECDENFLGKISSAASREKYQEKAGSPEPPTLAKFDDDFTVFVSAPAPKKTGSESGRSTPAGDEFENHDGLKPPGGFRTYNSLGSVSDFGGSDGGQDMPRVISDDKDEDLPTRDEILETSSRIFGQRGQPSSTTDSQGFELLGKTGEDEAQLDGDDEYDMPQFDLSKVLGTLQQMKEEISEMENEDERRKAAARVALGLVYGLEAKDDFD